MIAAPLSWTVELEKQIPSGSLNKGRTYFRSGAVQIVKGSASDVVATVSGGGAHDVEINLLPEEETLVVCCTCSHYQGLNICKHIWATLLKAESAGHLAKVSEILEPSIETELERELVEEEEEEEEEDDFQQPIARVPTRPALQPPPQWEQHLTRLALAAPVSSVRTEGPRRVVYVIDVAESESAGAIIVQAAVSRIKKNGDWSKPAFQESSIRSVSQLDVEDRRLLALLAGSVEPAFPYHNYYALEPDSVRSRYRLVPDAQDLLLPMLFATGRFYSRPSDRNEELQLLAWDDGPPWSVKTEIVRSAVDPEYVVFGYLEREGERLRLAEPLLLIAGLAVFRDRVARYDGGDLAQWVHMLRSAGDLHIPLKQRKEFVTLLAQLPVLPSIDFPQELRIESLVLDRPALQIRSLPDSRWREPKLAGSVTFHYGELRVSGGSTAASIYDKGRNRHFRRDRNGEQKALNRMGELGFMHVKWEKHQWELAPSRLPLVVRTLVNEGWLVEAEGKLYRRAGSFHVNVASGIDWFELQSHADFGGQVVEMPELLKAISRGDHLVQLGDGTFGLIPEDWLKRYKLEPVFRN